MSLPPPTHALVENTSPPSLFHSTNMVSPALLASTSTIFQARTAMTEMGASEEGVGFEQFVKYWNQLHAPDKPGASR